MSGGEHLGAVKTSEPFLVMAKPVGPVCNLDCGYCYYLRKEELFPRGERFRMREEVLESYVRSYIAASPGPTVHFVWHGGEPTLLGTAFYEMALSFQERHLPSGWSCMNSLQTNGSLLDERWCAFLAERDFYVGISLDGPAPLHDATRRDKRGRPTHARVMRGLRLLREHGIEPDVLCTLNARNVGQATGVYRFFLDAGVRWLQFLPVVAQAPGGASPLSVTPEQLGAFLCSVFDEWIRYDVGRIDVQNFLEAFLVVLGRPANLCVMAENCGRALAVEHDGSVYACDHFVDPDHRIGDVMTHGLAALVDGPEQRAFGRAKTAALPACCRTCDVRFLCNGGCPKDRFVSAPNGEAGLNYLCGGYRRFYEHALPPLRRMAALARSRRSVTEIMSELAVAERDERRAWQTAGRNDPCLCGSGRKHKYCCLTTHRH